MKKVYRCRTDSICIDFVEVDDDDVVSFMNGSSFVGI